VDSEKSLEKELADEIRAAIASAGPSAQTVSAGEGVPDPVVLAEAYVTPSIPEGAPASGLKKLLLRGSRFLWRNQMGFNTLALEAFRRMRQDWQESFASLREATERELAEGRRRAAIQDARFGLLEASPRAVAGSPVPTSAPAPEIPPAVYSLFEERFRGAPGEIAKLQRFYLQFLSGAPGPVLDVGCGRGEFLGLLREEKIAASGIESNPLSARLCREAGLEVEEGDALSLLSARPAASLGAVVALQVVEHWTAAVTFAFLREARRVLRPEGLLVAETINTDSLSALRAFFLDPTHVRPVPPAGLAFLAEAAGFADARIEYLAPLSPERRLAEATENDVKLNRLLFGPQDYALIARVPRA